MHTIAAGSPLRPQAVLNRDTADRDTADRVRESRRSRLAGLLEALAYAGASVDPIAALAAQRFAASARRPSATGAGDRSLRGPGVR
jgi:hypothetical protein